MKKALSMLMLLLLGVAPMAGAKCASEEYKVMGIITNAKGQKVEQAHITIAWIEVKEFKKSTTSFSDKNGKFDFNFMYYPWSNTVLGGDVCDAELSEASLTVTAKGYENYNSVIKFKDRQSLINVRLQEIPGTNSKKVHATR